MRLLLPCSLLLVSSFNNDIVQGLSLETASSSASSSSTSCSLRQTQFPNSIPVSDADIATLIRQTGQVNPSKAAIGIPSCTNCRHGFPQAFAMDPLPPSNTKGRINSGLLKLTCPLLVQAVDALEDDGIIPLWNDRYVKQDQVLQEDIQQTHALHAQVRQKLLQQQPQQPEDNSDIIRQKLGEKGAEAFLRAGVAGSSPESTDLKCLHAWLADALFRNNNNKVGNLIQKELQARGVSMTGTDDCRAYCDPNMTGAFSPPKPRNKQRLRTGKELGRRKRRKQELLQQLQPGDDDEL
ncbi:Protein of unknown function (DUF501) [Seminavis robusta]|uniref:Uncharacterized protein n=1 Tax=Seminavis robusta TaxID=568900 RepID=A0A9N8EZL3_9STRA|nr:Protein of unknown function (DUF501) [Seminavis robusta]|eukprot:Sro2763_g336550.1 Protein of unknown function (DUF501) (295) ;mRNA; r:8485-9369